MENDKREKLNERIKELLSDKFVLAFSGGVDSALILKLASLFRKRENDVVAIMYNTNTTPDGDLENAEKLAKEMGVRLEVVSIDVFDNDHIKTNTIDRCYHCKSFLFDKAFKLKDKLGYAHVVDGSNLDDSKVFRPGVKALNDKGVISPLKECSFTKEMVRAYAKELGLSVYKRPSAPCLATRFPYNELIDTTKFDSINKAEAYLKNLGLRNVRVRVYGDNTRIEVDKSDFAKVFDKAEEINKEFRELGFKYVNLDLAGFRSGSMDEVLRKEDKLKLNPWLDDER
ncbi:ATP-dependent sacrificial sulfur transferase LarE [uncultured Anaerococcus sp.]|uniref:ATP-dependent sacrificial sulfur transferase LarE n=1 Tax=uncultured Anaerococcus sp. TaxID=293428 RepID=UPI0026336ED6|nr:ATP-dependent sacrificial sulfur transferase LarE [uncultured Anaerococcus sp.]